MDSHGPFIDGVRFCGSAVWPLPGSDANHSQRLSGAAPRALTLVRNRVCRSRGVRESLGDTASSAPGWGIEPWAIRRLPSLPAGCHSGFVPGVGRRSDGTLSDPGLMRGEAPDYWSSTHEPYLAHPVAASGPGVRLFKVGAGSRVA